jgi:transcriptional regulator with XRE-family HTH domain
MAKKSDATPTTETPGLRAETMSVNFLPHIGSHNVNQRVGGARTNLLTFTFTGGFGKFHSWQLRCLGVLSKSKSTFCGVPIKIVSRLKELRKSHGLTQEEFSERSGISYKYYQAIEGGIQRDLRLSTWERLAKAYGIELWQLFSSVESFCVKPKTRNILITGVALFYFWPGSRKGGVQIWVVIWLEMAGIKKVGKIWLFTKLTGFDSWVSQGYGSATR